MGRETNYYDNRSKDLERASSQNNQANAPAPAPVQAAAPVQTAPVKYYDPNSEQSVGNKINNWIVDKTSWIPDLTYVPQVMAEGITGQPIDNWQEMSVWEKTRAMGQAGYKSLYKHNWSDFSEAGIAQKMAMGYVDNFKLAANTLKAAGKFAWGIPKEVAKGIVSLGASPIELTDRAMSKAFGWERMYPSSFNVPLLGQVDTAGARFDKHMEISKSAGLPETAAKFYSAIAATGESAGDVLMAFIPFDVGKYLATPKYKTLMSTTVRDTRPFVSEAKSSTIGKDGIEKITFSTPKQNPKTLVLQTTPEEAAALGGTTNNILKVIKPKGKGMANLSIVKEVKSPAQTGKDWLIRKFGKSRIVPGENGSLVKLYSEDIRYNQNFFEKPEYEIGITSFKKGQSTFNNGQPVSTVKEVIPYFELPEAKAFQKEIIDKSSKYGVSLIKIDKTAGWWEREIEPSFAVKVSGREKEVFTYASDLGSSRIQDGVILFRPSSVPNGTKILIKSVPEPDELLKIFHEAKIPGAQIAIEGDDIAVYDIDNLYGNAIIDIANKKQYATESKSGKIRLITDKQYAEYGIEQPKPGGGGQDLRVGDSLPAEIQGQSGVNKTSIPSSAESLPENGQAFSMQKAKAEGKSSESLPIVPSRMPRPLKGFEESLPTDKQVAQVLEFADYQKLEEPVIQALAKTLTTKDNIYDLTQNELYAISEAIGAFPEEAVNAIGDVKRFSSFMMEHKTWMSVFETTSLQAGRAIPIDSEVRMPIENGIRLRQLFTSEHVKKFDEVFGKYKDLKYVEEQRILKEYAEGNNAAILENKALSETVKKDLVKIGDWIKNYLKERFETGIFGITQSRFYNKYMPAIQKAGGIERLYKESELPPELKVFAQFEREGQFNVLEDNALALLQIYADMEGKLRFIKAPYEHAVKVIGYIQQPVVKERMMDWLQEVLGRGDKWEKSFNDWGIRLSEKTHGIIPKNISKQIVQKGMSLAYAGALGLPRVMPIAREFLGQNIIMPYSYYGSRYFATMAKTSESEAIKELKSLGFHVEGGVYYGSEYSEKTGQGWLGKGLDKYIGFNEQMMKPYAYNDLRNRAYSMATTKIWFNQELELLQKGKITWDQFYERFEMNRFSPTVQNVIADGISKGTEEAIEYTRNLAIKEDLDAIQFGLRKGSGSAFHHGLRGKALGQFTLFTWGYATYFRDIVVRKQWDKLFRLLGAGTAVKRSFEETTGIDISKWIMFGPFDAVPQSPLLRIATTATSGINNALNNYVKGLNENYEEIARSLQIFGGTFTGVGKQRLERFMESVKEYKETPYPTYDPATGEKRFVIHAAPKRGESLGRAIQTVDFKGLLLYTFGFTNLQSEKEWDAMDLINKREAEEEKKIDKAIGYLKLGEIEKYIDIVVENQLNIDPSTRLDSYSKSVLQRTYERMSDRDKAKYWNIVAPLLYEK